MVLPFVFIVMKDAYELENKSEAQVEVIRQIAFFCREIAIIRLDYDIRNRLVLQAELVNLLVFRFIVRKSDRCFGDGIQLFITEERCQILCRIGIQQRQYVITDFAVPAVVFFANGLTFGGTQYSSHLRYALQNPECGIPALDISIAHALHTAG